MAGHDHDYSFGNKKNWRRWAWNRIGDACDVLKKPRQDATVIYLSGANDYDGPISLAKGFSRHNLIAVERSQSAVSSIREKGRLCVYGDVFDALAVWPNDRAVDVLHLDLCGGLSDKIFDRILMISWLKPFRNSILSINMLRGRDHGEVTETWRDMLGKSEEARHAKHRGCLLTTALVYQHMCMAVRAVGLARGKKIDWQSSDEIRRFADGFLYLYANDYSLKTFSYRSGFQTFDSFVMPNPGRHVNDGPPIDDAIAQKNVMDIIFAGRDESARAQKARNAAVFAHQTRRKAA